MAEYSYESDVGDNDLWLDDQSLASYRLDTHDRDDGSFNSGEIQEDGWQYIWINSYFDSVPEDGCNIPYRYEHTISPDNAYASECEDPIPIDGSQSGDEITLDIGAGYAGLSASLFELTVYNPSSVNTNYGDNNNGIYWSIDPGRSPYDWPEDEDVDNTPSENADPDSTQCQVQTNKNLGDTVTVNCTGEYTWTHSSSKCGTGGGYIYRYTGELSLTHDMVVVE